MSRFVYRSGIVLGCLVIAGACSAPQTPATAEGTTELLVSAEIGGEVIVVDPASGQILERIKVGKRPRGLQLSPDGRRLYVALSGSPISPPGVDESTLPPPDRSADGIGVVDLETRQVMGVLPSGQDPETFDVSPDGRMLYISNEETAEMTALDVSSGKVRGVVPVGEEPEGVTVRPDGKVVYVTCEGTHEVVVVDTGSLEVIARVPTGRRPRSITFTEDGAIAFVTAELGQTVAVIDGQRHESLGQVALSETIPSRTPLPMGSVLSPDGDMVFISNGRGQSVTMLDVETRSVVRTVEHVGARPWGIDVSADGRYAYTANGPSDDVSVIDVRTGTVARRIPIPGRPWGVVSRTADSRQVTTEE